MPINNDLGSTYKILVEESLVGVYIIQDGRFTYVNPRFAETFGYSQDEIIRLESLSQLVAPIDRERVDKNIQRRLKNSVASLKYQFQGVRKDNSLIHIEVLGSLTTYRDRPAIIGSLLDITEHVQAQARLEFIADCSAVLSATLEYSTIFKKLAKLTVPKLGDSCVIDVLNEHNRFKRMAFAHIDPSKEPLLEELGQRYPIGPNSGHPILEAMRTQKPITMESITREALVRGTYDETHRNMLFEVGLGSCLAVPLTFRDRCHGIIMFMSGGKGRHYTSDELNLATEVARRAAIAVENAELFNEAKNAISTRNEFISIASHELRTPLTILLGQIQLLKIVISKTGVVLDKTATDLLNGSEDQTKRLARLVSKLFDFASLNSSKIMLELESMDLTQLANDVAKAFLPEAAIFGSTISVKKNEAVIGRWDRSRLEEVVMNLVSNAAKYAAGTPIELSVTTQGQNAVLKVSDRGPGIAVKDQARIFQSFERGDTKNHKNGLGLGLYITRKIVEAHGGAIEIQSEVGQGSTFIVRLPLS